MEQGAHADLMKQGGHYHALVTAQMGNVERDGEMTESKIFVQDYDEDAKDVDMITEEVSDFIPPTPSIDALNVSRQLLF